MIALQPIEGTSKISFGLVMLAENTIILFFLVHMMVHVKRRLKKIRHEHVSWRGGQIFLVYLGFVLTYNLLEFSALYFNYLVSMDPVDFMTVVFRVSGRTLLFIAKFCLWYYTIFYEFNLFRKKYK